MGDSEYSFSLTTFSPAGKLVQIEYALNAVQSGGTTLGVKATNGVVIATEKKLPSTLIDSSSFSKISLISENIGLCYSGMGPDARVLIKKGQKKAQQYFQTYKENIPVLQIVKELATVMQEYTQSGGVRPFGVSLLVSGYDEEGAHLYQVDPSGSYWAWKASAIGKNMVNANTFLEKRYQVDGELEDAVHTAILTLKEGFDGQMNEHNIEIAKIGKDKLFHILTPNEIKDYLTEVE
jgi:20S proteasome subunit alpha 2